MEIKMSGREWAWSQVNKFFTDYVEDEQKSTEAGHPIYIRESCPDHWIEDFGDHLELRLSERPSDLRNVWIDDYDEENPALYFTLDKYQEYYRWNETIEGITEIVDYGPYVGAYLCSHCKCWKTLVKKLAHDTGWTWVLEALKERPKDEILYEKEGISIRSDEYGLMHIMAQKYK